MNGILIVDKPSGWTSHDVIAKLRGLLKVKRIGHSGTLDPMATGVLPVFIGRATRAVEFCMSDDKEYLAALRLGIVTDTQDITGSVIASPGAAVSEEELVKILPRFSGEITQIPPMYSAIKVGGKPLYALARRGERMERAGREITIHELTCLGRAPEGDFLLRVTCSKGTYIRTLCHDIGEKLGCGGALSALRRTRAGRFTADGALTMEAIISLSESGGLSGALLPVDSLFQSLPEYILDGQQMIRCKNGAPFAVCGMRDDRYRVYSPEREFLMLGEAEDGVMKTVKSFFEV